MTKFNLNYYEDKNKIEKLFEIKTEYWQYVYHRSFELQLGIHRINPVLNQSNISVSVSIN